MSAHHRFVLVAPAGTVVPPYHAVFAKHEPSNPKFRGRKPALTLAGTHAVNNYHWDEVKADLESLAPDARRTLSEGVETMVTGKTSAKEIREYICEAFNKPIVTKLDTRQECRVHYGTQDAIFIGISIGTQTPGHLQDHNFIEVHTVLAGCCRLRVGTTANLRVGDAVFGQVPLFNRRTRPIGYVVSGVSDTDVLVSVDPHNIGRT